MFSPSLIGYYRGDFTFFATKVFRDQESWDAFLQKNSKFAIDVIPNINFETRQLIVASSRGPHLIGLFKTIRITDSIYRFKLKRIKQTDDIVGTSASLLFTFPKEYKVKIRLGSPVTLESLEPKIAFWRSCVFNAEAMGELAVEASQRDLERYAEKLRIFFLREKAESEWTTVFRYCGYSLEEEDMFNYIPS
jgi:hypothetical protein